MLEGARQSVCVFLKAAPRRGRREIGARLDRLRAKQRRARRARRARAPLGGELHRRRRGRLRRRLARRAVCRRAGALGADQREARAGGRAGGGVVRADGLLHRGLRVVAVERRARRGVGAPRGPRRVERDEQRAARAAGAGGGLLLRSVGKMRVQRGLAVRGLALCVWGGGRGGAPERLRRRFSPPQPKAPDLWEPHRHAS